MQLEGRRELGNEGRGGMEIRREGRGRGEREIRDRDIERERKKNER